MRGAFAGRGPIWVVLGCLTSGAAWSQDAPVLHAGDIVFETDFEGADALEGWSGGLALVPGFASANAIASANPPAPGTPLAAQYLLPAERLRGYLLNLSCMVKADDVSKKPNSWNGIKFMLPVEYDGKTMYPQAAIGVGTFDWQRVTFAVRVPDMATDINLHMGIEAVKGRAWFDDIRIVVRRLPFRPKPPVTTGEPFRGHDLPRLRGAMVSPRIDEDGLRLFGGDWNANVIRWQLVNWRLADEIENLDDYDRWLEGELERLDAALSLCEKYGLYVVVDLHSKPCGPTDSGKDISTDPACQDRFVENWKRMAARYRDSKVVWGYDLANEPSEGAVPEGVLYWDELAEKTARAVRDIDSDHAIIVEPAHGGGPSSFRQLNPIDVPGIVYSVHMYLPHAFTHQGVRDNWPDQLVYPGEIEGTVWDRARLEEALQPVVDFQQRYRAHIFVGEFSAIRWAPEGSAHRYLRDCIDVFEQHGWDWTYHAFREWSGWSVEHGADRENTQPAEEQTDREKLLHKWFAMNERPEW